MALHYLRSQHRLVLQPVVPLDADCICISKSIIIRPRRNMFMHCEGILSAFRRRRSRVGDYSLTWKLARWVCVWTKYHRLAGNTANCTKITGLTGCKRCKEVEITQSPFQQIYHNCFRIYIYIYKCEYLIMGEISGLVTCLHLLLLYKNEGTISQMWTLPSCTADVSNRQQSSAVNHDGSPLFGIK